LKRYNAKEVKLCIEILIKGDHDSCKQVTKTLAQNGWFKRPENIPIILNLLTSDNWTTKLFTLQSIPDEIYFEKKDLNIALRRLLTDASYKVQLEVLNKFSHGLAIPIMEPQVKQAIKLEPIIPILVTLLKNDYGAVRSNAAGLLAQIAYNDERQFDKFKNELIECYPSLNGYSGVYNYMSHTKFGHLFPLR
jgi:hypothetical protein